MTDIVVRYETEDIGKMIFTVRGQRVILDSDLAAVYGVSTKALNQAIKRNADRFPDDFAFQLTHGRGLWLFHVTICDLEQKSHAVTNCDRIQTKCQVPPLCLYRAWNLNGC